MRAMNHEDIGETASHMNLPPPVGLPRRSQWRHTYRLRRHKVIQNLSTHSHTPGPIERAVAVERWWTKRAPAVEHFSSCVERCELRADRRPRAVITALRPFGPNNMTVRERFEFCDHTRRAQGLCPVHGTTTLQSNEYTLRGRSSDEIDQAAGKKRNLCVNSYGGMTMCLLGR